MKIGSINGRIKDKTLGFGEMLFVNGGSEAGVVNKFVDEYSFETVDKGTTTDCF